LCIVAEIATIQLRATPDSYPWRNHERLIHSYPLGKLEIHPSRDDATRAKRIAIIAETPAKFRAAQSSG